MLESVPFKRAQKIQAEAVRDAEAEGWIALTIQKDTTSFSGYVGVTEDRKHYPLSEVSRVSRASGQKWYCELDSHFLPGKVCARPHFQLFDLEREQKFSTGVASELVRKIMGDLQSKRG